MSDAFYALATIKVVVDVRADHFFVAVETDFVGREGRIAYILLSTCGWGLSSRVA